MIWRGIAIGVLISAPMGPVGILCIQRTLDKGRKAGFFTGIGASISDLFYCLLTVFGLSFIEDFIERNQNIIQIAGSAVLIAFSIYLFRKNPSSSLRRPVPQGVSAKKNILGGFLFTFSNPLILFLTIGLFARFNFLLPEMKIGHYIIGFIFIMVGAIGWWYGVTFVINKIRLKFSLRSMKRINIGIGIVILLFALVGIISGTLNLITPSASAAEIRHWNHIRGYAPFSDTVSDDGKSIILENIEAAEAAFYVDIDSTSSSAPLSFRFTLSQLNPVASSPHYSYPVTTDVLHSSTPACGIRLYSSSTGQAVDFIILHTVEQDPLYGGSCITVHAIENRGSGTKRIISRKIIRKGLDCSGNPNRFALERSDVGYTLRGGNHGMQTILEIDSDNNILEMMDPDSIGFILYPGAKCRISDITLEISPHPRYPSPMYDVLAQHPDRESIDSPLVGNWSVYDFSFDTSAMISGGDYEITITEDTNAPGHYNILYLSGANIWKEKWETGMLKGRMSPTSTENIFRLDWYDASGTSLGASPRADLNTEIGLLTLHFPDLNSKVRFIRHGQSFVGK